MEAVQLLGVSLLIVYLLVRDVIGPLVKKVLGGKDKEAPPSEVARLAVLELDMTTAKARILDFAAALDEQGKNLDNKLDMVLAEITELRNEHAEAHRLLGDRIGNLGERIKGAEVHIEHLLKNRPIR